MHPPNIAHLAAVWCRPGLSYAALAAGRMVGRCRTVLCGMQGDILHFGNCVCAAVRKSGRTA